MIEQTKPAAEKTLAAPATGPEQVRRTSGAPAQSVGSRKPLEWFFRTRSLRVARTTVVHASSSANELRRRARLSYELAERVLDPIEPLAAGSGVALAAELFRQSAHWALCVTHHDARAVASAQLWNPELEAALAGELPDAEAMQAARQLLRDASFVSLAELSAEQQLRCALQARTLATLALDHIEQPERRVQSLLWQRVVRLGLLTLVLAAIVIAGVLGSADLHQGPDLALGKPWHASSSWGECDPVAARCGGVRTRIFFHTKEDASPWIEYDLGRPVEFSRVSVRNRTDSVPDRAIPLLIEVSDDQNNYREVARRTVTFRTWTADFHRQRARYVRLRVARRSWLHLERVSIYRPE